MQDKVDKLAEAIIKCGKINVNSQQLAIFKNAVRESSKKTSAA
jgi:hypothetical protein